MKTKKFEYLILGAGIIGSAVAFNLSKRLRDKDKNISIAVIDLDLDGEFSSTLKNAGGVRATWRNKSNIQLCNYSIRFFEKISDKISFKQKGYYWLHNEKTWEEINNNLKLYESFGLDVELANKNVVKNILPFIDNLDGIYGLSISKNAGLIDHYSLREFFRINAKNTGVKFLDRQYIFDIEVVNKTAKKVYSKDFTNIIKRGGSEVIKEILKDDIIEEYDPDINVFEVDNLINCTGAWSAKLSSLYGFNEDENKPRRRQLELIQCPKINLSKYGMIIDTSDIYFHAEGDKILVGYSNMDEPFGVNFKFDFFAYDEKSPFVEYIWKPLIKRSLLFEDIKFIRGWAGIYGETPDRSGYLGKVPGLNNVFECVGHTGRGLMISYGSSQSLVDLIVDGKIREDLRFADALERLRPEGPQFEELHL